MSKDISKFLSYILRHKPDAIGLELDAQGWAGIDEIIAKADQPITRAQVENAVRDNDKKRFSLSPDGQRIRARQGHSVAVDLGLEPVDPPATLYHGTATKNVDSILREGLKPGSRQHVHLSPDPGTARKVGMRHGKPVVLTVDASALHAAGQVFYQSENGVWLTGPVSPEHLKPMS
ncbi:MAG: RNA 2'-phosphotransferase [Brevirhabdus sp.]